MSAFVLFVMILVRPTSGNLSFLRYEIIYDKSADSGDDDGEENVFVRQ